MSTSPSRRRAIVLGVVIVVVGVIAVIAFWVAGSARKSNAIENYARAPVGCDTTLDFAEAGTYLLFVEGTGRVGQVRGDCDAAETYDSDVGPDDVTVTVVDPDGNVVDLRDPPTISYSSGDYAGQSAFEIDIEDATDHVIRVESEAAGDFVVAVGRDPDDGVALLRTIGLLLALAGTVTGLVVVLAVGRGGSSPGSTTVGASPWAAPPPTQPLYRPPAIGSPPGPAAMPGALPPSPGGFAPPSPGPPSTSAPPTGQTPPSAPAASPAPEWGGPTDDSAPPGLGGPPSG